LHSPDSVATMALGIGEKSREDMLEGAVIRPKRIYFPEHFCYCFASNLCILDATNTD
jgi:hypothetical protein